MNVPDERVFHYHCCRDYPERDPARPFVVMFHGSIVERNGLDTALVDDVKVGDYVVLHVGYALAKIDPEEAQKTIELLNSVGAIA